MNDFDGRLAHCVLSVFPALPAAELETMSLAECAAMDSLAAVSLIAVVRDEFGVDLDMEALLAMGSLAALQREIRRRQAASAAGGSAP